MDTFNGLARIELWWVRNGGRGRFKREGWFAHCGVLVKRNEFRVRDDLYLLWSEFRELREANVRIRGDWQFTNRKITHLRTQQDWTFHERPNCEVCTLLLNRQISVADFHHVHVVVREKVDRGQVVDVCLDYRFYVLPSRADVVTGLP